MAIFKNFLTVKKLRNFTHLALDHSVNQTRNVWGKKKKKKVSTFGF